MLIYRYNPTTKEVGIAHTFPPGQIRHVHGVHYDPFTESIWVVTGDLPHECKMLYTHDHFKSICVVGEGDESWRCLSPIFTKDYVFYGTDSEFQKNYIYRFDRKSGKRDIVAQIDGPVYYSKLLGDDMFFATTVEYCPSLHPLRQPHK